MKIEIVSGTKDDPPMGHNTKIKFNGKDMTESVIIDTIYFKVKAGEIASWGISFEGDTWLTRLQTKFHKIRRKLKRGRK